MQGMRVVVSQRVVDNQEYVERRDALSQEWTTYLEMLIPGCVIVPMPNRLGSVNDWLKAIEPNLIILSNGNDWGKATCRDKTEEAVVKWAVEKKILLIGVCRGFQALNVIFGGAIEEDLNTVTSQNHVATTHVVRITQDAFLELTDFDEVDVNSFHNQGISKATLAETMIPFAMAQDDVVEGFYSSEHNILAVQWHPERAMSNNKFDHALLTKFIFEGAFWNEC